MGIDATYNPTYNLRDARKQRAQARQPVAHQNQALRSLHRWYEKPTASRGGLLVLPTGGGKTFTAMRFLCSHPLSEGYRVLWLAHTHHLLEQAHGALPAALGSVAEPKDFLKTRVVSGTEGHFKVQHIASDDDVLFATLQTMTRALKAEQPSLLRFLDAAADKLFVVFDEAHHAPASTYRRLITGLRARFPNLGLLGLTGTPTYTDERKRGWFQDVFPQEIVHQVAAERLIAANILAKPIFKDVPTHVTPEFDDRLFQRWSATNLDLPSEIVDALAKNDMRNQYIVKAFLDEREKYGQTIIFADRWYQCEALAALLEPHGVKVGTVYSHIERGPATAEAREKRTRDSNARAIEQFRRGDLDVLINILMLTEGTDVPNVKTVFLTRQTTSRIMATQMVGRALRGTEFGGTPEAYIVSFIDDWRQLINFASWDRLSGGFDESGQTTREGPPMHFISIKLVRDLVRRMDTGINVATGPFLDILPVGWYSVEYSAQIEGSDDTEPVHRPLLIYNTSAQSYEKLIDELMTIDLKAFEEPDIDEQTLAPVLDGWIERWFTEQDVTIGSGLRDDVLAIARHIGQTGTRPRFRDFEQRDLHDLDKLAQQCIDKDWGPRAIRGALQSEYNRMDRSWTMFYPSFLLFKGQYDATVNRLLSPAGDEPVAPRVILPRSVPTTEVDDATRAQVKERDSHCCLACGSPSRRLQIDHIVSQYFEGSNILDNLQTLCGPCNRLKNTEYINFRDPQTDLRNPPTSLSRLELPRPADAGDAEVWQRYLQRAINWFYRCGAVHSVQIGKRGHNFYHWRVELRAGNDPQWLAPHVPALRAAICAQRDKVSRQGPDTITIDAPGAEPCSG